MKTRACELCNGEASLYCVSDSAFLCWNCDARVHEANFLVARHVRCSICCKCKSFDGNRFSGCGFRPKGVTCRSCLDEEEVVTSDSDSYSSTSTCISSADSGPKKRGVRAKFAYSGGKMAGNRRTKTVSAEVLLVNWSRKLGVKRNFTVCIQRALHAFDTYMNELTYLPFRACLASSLWLALKSNKSGLNSRCPNLKRFADVCGVPAKLIVMVEKKISRVLKSREDEIDLEEGWAECDD